MPVVSSSIFRLATPCGKSAVYSLEPDQVAGLVGADAPSLAMKRGKHIASENGGDWFKPSGEIITDLRTIALLERAPDLVHLN